MKIITDHKSILKIHFGSLLGRTFSSDSRNHQNKTIQRSGKTKNKLETRCLKQLGEYQAGKRKIFKLVLNPSGTAFQKKVWQQLLKIPYGKTLSYQAVAKAIGKPKASRAVGGACHANPIMIVIPCHRVLASDGGLGGYAGGVAMKRRLLALEQSSQ